MLKTVESQEIIISSLTKTIRELEFKLSESEGKECAMLTADLLRWLRLKGIVFVFYGGKALAANEASDKETWHSALEGILADFLENDNMPESVAYDLVRSIESGLFDLNGIKPESAGAAVAQAIGKSKGKV